MTEAAKYNVIFVLGGPGAGKGTQCDKIIRKFGYVHLSAGDLLRAERKDKQSELGEEIARHIEVGSIVPVAITCALLQREMKKAKENDNKDSFLIDGFPRNKDNLDGWNKEMSEKVNLKTVLFFNCPEDICVDRCIERGKTSGRSDDNRESLKKRLQTYTECTMPIIEHYRSMNLVSEVCAKRSAEEVFEDVEKIISGL
ncbi:UMP-CMP kinase-like [Mizuhopecten yessoensis]|uniref:UMP-CMP kinase-like n=1 Tax=Mizuhopecten yessoensis TaxID=6573 RepID=UPI000B4585BE|nr:UMP-CMP kinase-like [Mizuhopecten yessoensis]